MVTLESIVRLKNLRSRMDRLRPAAGAGINRYEYRVFSQHREDGIITHIVDHAGVKSGTCVEFGFGPGQNNCLNLVVNHGFRGLFMDGKRHNADQLDRYLRRKGNLSRAVNTFLDAENINRVIEENGFRGRIGVLSIDVDGNDYWLWKALNVISPDLVVIEYNASFGSARAITVPYDPGFVRYQQHVSGLYHGASLKALEILGGQKGYVLVGCDSSGVNAFFIKKKLVCEAIPASDTGHVFKDHRSRVKYKKLSPQQQWLTVAGMPYVEIRE